MNFSQVLNRFPFGWVMSSWRVPGFSSAMSNQLDPSTPTQTRFKTLDSAREGQVVTVAHVNDPGVAAQLLRLGVMTGECIRVLSKTPGDGPIVIQLGDNRHSELAIGRAYAQEIQIQDNLSL
jgi:Fe2+ transport system protein FeoA